MGTFPAHPDSVESTDLQNSLCFALFGIHLSHVVSERENHFKGIQFTVFIKTHNILETSLEHHFRVQVTQLHKHSTFQDFCN